MQDAILVVALSASILWVRTARRARQQKMHGDAKSLTTGSRDKERMMPGWEYKWENHAVYIRKSGEVEWKLFMYFPTNSSK